jgi:uncharacterized HAD superfamily protein
MKIGTDLDEVLSPFVRIFLPFYNQRHGTSWKEKDMWTYNFTKALGISDKEVNAEIEEFRKGADYKTLPLIKGAFKGIEELSKQGDIYIITGRQIEAKEITEKWVEKNFDGYIKDICFSDFRADRGFITPKHEFCKKLGIDLMIEDLAESALEIYRKCDIPVIVPRYPWNLYAEAGEFIGTKCSHVDGWKGIRKEARKYF